MGFGNWLRVLALRALKGCTAMPIVCMPVARMEAIDQAREALAGARECMIDARAAALRSRVEELALASFHKDDVLAGKTRSHLTAPEQTKVRGLSTALL